MDPFSIYGFQQFIGNNPETAQFLALAVITVLVAYIAIVGLRYLWSFVATLVITTVLVALLISAYALHTHPENPVLGIMHTSQLILEWNKMALGVAQTQVKAFEMLLTTLNQTVTQKGLFEK